MDPHVNNQKKLHPIDEDSIILLTGAGASGFIGMKTLEDIVKHISDLKNSINPRVMETILDTWTRVVVSKGKHASIEDVIAKLKTYLDAATLMADDKVFRQALGSVPHQVNTGEFTRIWEEALIECYRILLDNYGPQKVKIDGNEFKATIDLIKILTTFNKNGELHIFTTNYDCTYNVIASKTNQLCFISHIDNEQGHFRDKWYYVRPELKHLENSIYLHRLHGCVAWFYDDSAPYRLKEIYGSGEKLEIKDSHYLNRMCIKLVPSEEIGTNPAFSLEFREFYKKLKVCKMLFVWGHSFRDIEVLRTIKGAIDTRNDNDMLEILYVDPYLSPERAIQNIHDTLARVPIGGTDILPKRVDWVIQDGNTKLLSLVKECIEKILHKEGEKDGK